jgi:hypothetical protein
LLRELMSAGRLRYPVVQKIDGQMVTTTIEKEGSVAFMVTTTRNKLNHENETRMLSLEVDDSEEQTRAVLQKVALVEGRNQRGKAVDLQPWHDFQRWLAAGECDAVVKFSLTLASMIPPRAVRLRRDFSQLLLAIKAHALLHRHHRKRDADGAIVATIGEDYATVRDLMSDLLAITADTACSEAVRETIAAVRTCQPLVEGGASIRDVADKLKLDRSATWRRLRSAIDGGYVANLKQGKRGQPGEYRTTGELPPDPDEFLPSVEDLRAELKRRRRSHRR